MRYLIYKSQIPSCEKSYKLQSRFYGMPSKKASFNLAIEWNFSFLFLIKSQNLFSQSWRQIPSVIQTTKMFYFISLEAAEVEANMKGRREKFGARLQKICRASKSKKIVLRKLISKK